MKINKTYLEKKTNSYVRVVLFKDCSCECHIEMFKNSEFKKDDFWFKRYKEKNGCYPQPDFTTYGFGESFKDARKEAYKAVLSDWPNNPK